MSRWVWSALLLLISWPLLAVDRVALVIGNAAYTNAPLANPLRDARAMERVLDGLGFQVTRLEDGDRTQMMRAVQAFRKQLQSGGIGLFYYSGHGVEIGGKNYLLPVGSTVRTQEDVLVEGLDAAYVVAQMDAAGSQLNLVVLDACRDNPLPSGSKGAGKGLGRMDADAGTLIAFATATGQTAADGEGANSPYTTVLIERLQQPNLSVSEIFNEVNLEVARRTKNQQRPWYSTSGVPTLRLAGSAAVLQRPVADIPADLGELRIEVIPASAKVRLDGDLLGTGSRNLKLTAGKRVVLRAEAEGYEAAEERVLVQSGQVTDVPLHLKALAPATVVTPAARPAAIQAPTPAPASAGSRQAGSVFRDSLRGGGEGPEMVVIPAGSFVMGSPASEAGRYGDEGPQRRVTIRSFAMGTTEVTFADYDRCTAAGVCAQADDEGLGRGTRPVINVSWNDAQGYARWLSDQTGKRYRLPSEAEWEYAARGGTQSAYWWGDSASHEHANYGKDECCAGLAQGRDQWEFTAPVKSFAANGFGLYEVSGNVWEWVQDCYKDSYAGAPTDGKAVDATNCDERVLRGASWYFIPATLRVAQRKGTAPVYRGSDAGFRLAEDL